MRILTVHIFIALMVWAADDRWRCHSTFINQCCTVMTIHCTCSFLQISQNRDEDMLWWCLYLCVAFGSKCCTMLSGLIIFQVCFALSQHYCYLEAQKHNLLVHHNNEVVAINKSDQAAKRDGLCSHFAEIECEHLSKSLWIPIESYSIMFSQIFVCCFVAWCN